MKYALVDGVRQEATPKLLGACIGCGSPMIAKCGAKKLHHWAHKGRLECDHW
jgi:competence CoiA-like predicted nuclease